jgi:hypothetical protein
MSTTAKLNVITAPTVSTWHKNISEITMDQHQQLPMVEAEREVTMTTQIADIVRNTHYLRIHYQESKRRRSSQSI